MSRHGRVAAVLAGVVAGALLASSCGGGPSNATLPPEAKGRATVYVALGGDDNGARQRRNLGAAWPQVVFRTAFPRTAVFYNLSSPRAGAAAILDQEVDQAVALRPDVVTITVLDDAEHGTPPAVVQSDLVSAIDRLRGRSSTRVLVGTLPDTIAPPAATQPLDAAIAAATGTAGAALVDLSAVRGANEEAMGPQIAHAFAAALRAK